MIRGGGAGIAAPGGAAGLLLAALLAVVICCSASPGEGTAPWRVQQGAPVVRLHVRASGDSPAEQRFKMELVAQVLRLLSEKSPPGTGEVTAYLEFLEGALPELEGALQEYAHRFGQGSPVAVGLSRESFPLRAYGRRIFPAGVYTALLITIGEGTGENWWCLLFPQLCLPPAVPADPVAIPGEEGETAGAIRWQSKIWELFKRAAQSVIENAERIFYN